MPADSDLLFGKIAVARGFCTEEQVEACVKAQSSSKDPEPLGKMLIREGHLTESQYTTVLDIQRQKMQEADPVNQGRLNSALFGRLVIRRGLLSEAKVNECLREQAQHNDGRSLGEVIVEKHLLSPKQVREVLAEQCKTIMQCLPCGFSFTILSTTRRKLIDCPRCNKPLTTGKESDSTRADGEIETRFAKSLKSESVPVETRPPSDEKKAAVPVTCRMCGHEYMGVPDSTNRVRCPQCDTRYVSPESAD